MSKAGKNIRQLVTTSRASESKSQPPIQEAFGQRTNTGQHIMPQGTYHTSQNDTIKAPTGIPSRRPPLLNSAKSSNINVQAGIQKQNSSTGLNQSQLRMSSAGQKIMEEKQRPGEGVPVPTTKKDYEPISDAQLEGMSQFDLRQNYKDCRKEYLNKKLTVGALQRNFEVLSKLCQQEQVEKQKLINQNQEFGKDIQDRAKRLCELHDKVAELEKERDDLKGKAKDYDKIQFENKKLQQQLDASKSENERLQQKITDLKKSLTDQKQEFKTMSDQFGNHEDAMAAAEFKALGLQQDLKEAHKEIEQLKAEVLQAQLKLTNKADEIGLGKKEAENAQLTIKEKDLVIEKKEKLIQEYKSDLERERRDKSDLQKKIKELSQLQEESKYMLMQKGNSQTEQNKRIEELTQMLTQKQSELAKYSQEVDSLKETLYTEQQNLEKLSNEKNKILVSKRESEMQLGHQQKNLEFVTQSVDKYKATLDQKEQELRDQQAKLVSVQQNYESQLKQEVSSKDQQRAEYISAMEKQREEIATLSSKLTQWGQSGKQMDERTRFLEEEIGQLRQKLQESEQQMCTQASEMAEQINTYKQKLNQMLDQIEGKESLIQNKENQLRSKEQAILQTQNELLKQKQDMSKMDQDLLNKQNKVQQLQEQTHEITKQREEYVKMANQLEQRLEAVSEELTEARKQKGAQQQINDLQKKSQELETQMKSLKAQKDEMTQRMEELIKEKKDAVEQRRQAEYSSKIQRESRETAEKKLAQNISENSARVRDHMAEKEQLNKVIEQQKQEVIKTHNECDELKKRLDFWKSQVDEINDKFGGFQEVERQIKLAKVKEQAVGNLWQKLNTCIQSTEGNLQCFKCIEIAKDPVVLVPCGHLLCKGCVPNDRVCPDCSGAFRERVPVSFVNDLANKHEFNKDALSAFKNDKTWENVLKGMN